MTNMAIQCTAVRKVYPHFTLNDIDLAVPEGSVMGFVGPNGAGKTTTLRIIMGLIHQDRGEVSVLGKTMPNEQIVAKRDIGFVSEDMRLYPQRSIRFHMDFIRSIFDSWDDTYAEELLSRFGLIGEQRVKGLSHGQRVKASLLMVFARRPKLLVFDEPTSGLDPAARHEILDEMMNVLADETRTILFSSHNTLDVEQISDHIAFIQDGSITDCGDKESYLERWRRIRLEVPEGFELPTLPEFVEMKHSGRIVVVTTNHHGPTACPAFDQPGVRVTDVERLTLEEIFLASVHANKRENIQ